MRSSKSRSRNKSNRQRSLGNIVNRVFDSSGPEGKVRGTPQQIIDKYLALARDAQLSNDRVAEQSFLQHAEHYTRMLGEAQRENAERQQQHQNQQNQRQNGDDDRDGNNSREQNSRENGPRDNGQRDNGQREGGNRDNAPRDQRDGNGNRDHGPGEGQDSRPQPEETVTPPVAEAPRRGRARRAANDDQPQVDGGGEDRPQTGLPDALPSGDDEDGPVATPESEGARKPRAKTTRPRTPRSPTGRTRRKAGAEDHPGDAPAEPQANPAENGAEQG